jgi:hypothetical protein
MSRETTGATAERPHYPFGAGIVRASTATHPGLAVVLNGAGALSVAGRTAGE